MRLLQNSSKHDFFLVSEGLRKFYMIYREPTPQADIGDWKELRGEADFPKICSVLVHNDIKKF